MPSHIWSRDDLFNILLAIYSAKLPPPQEAPAVASTPEVQARDRLYRWGCRAAVQSLMLAFGLPLQLLDPQAKPPGPTPSRGSRSTEHFWLEDLENIIAAIHRSAVSTPVDESDLPYMQYYRQGFSEVIESILHAIGSRKDLRRWLEQALSARYWDLSSEQGAPIRWIGSPPDAEEPQ